MLAIPSQEATIIVADPGSFRTSDLLKSDKLKGISDDVWETIMFAIQTVFGSTLCHGFEVGLSSL
jgi:hypothetical protein